MNREGNREKLQRKNKTSPCPHWPPLLARLLFSLSFHGLMIRCISCAPRKWKMKPSYAKTTYAPNKKTCNSSRQWWRWWWSLLFFLKLIIVHAWNAVISSKQNVKFQDRDGGEGGSARHTAIVSVLVQLHDLINILNLPLH